MTDATRAPAKTGLRTFLHAGTGLMALSLGLLPPPLALTGAALGIGIGWIVIPRTRLEARLRRPGEPFWGGLRTYPLAVFGLVFLLPPAQAAAAWGVLAFGDTAAAVVGQRVRAPSLFGHPKATWSGTTAYLLVGTAAAWLLSRGVGYLGPAAGWVEVSAVPSLTACAAAAAAAALVDLVPIPPDDNLPGAAAAGIVLGFIG